MLETRDEVVLSKLVTALGESGAAGEVAFTGRPGELLPSAYAVTVFASASVALATRAASELSACRTGRPPPLATVDRLHAAVAFRSERYLEAVGWELPAVWDPIAGDYAARDGFVRLHTNYRYHRDAVLRVLGTEESRDAVKRAVATWDGEALESAVVAEGGCAAKMRSAEEFAAHEAGRAVFAEPLFAWTERAGDPWALPFPLRPEADAPLEGLRVLDLTRVIAGPVCTRFLAAHGADVLRVDPPAFEEVPALLTETTGGKRRTALDLRSPEGRATFARLISEAHVLVVGYRPGGLERMGLGAAWRRETNPALITVALDAYGWTGPWAARRGFDSLVQMSAGIAARGRDVTGSPKPHPLPAQALDHGTGYLAAAAVCRALSRRAVEGTVNDVHLSLARTARFLMEQGDDGDPRAPDLTAQDAAPYREDVATPWGAVRRVRCPGRMGRIFSSVHDPPGAARQRPATLLVLDHARRVRRDPRS